MRILIECRRIVPDHTLGAEYFLYSLVSGLRTAHPEDRVQLNVSPGTIGGFRKYIPDPKVELITDEMSLAYHRIRRSSTAARYTLGVLRRGLPPLAALSGNERRGWVRRCERSADVVFYPTSLHPLVHRNVPSVITAHDFREFDLPPADTRRSRRIHKHNRRWQAFNVAHATAIVCSWPHPFEFLRERFPSCRERSFMIPFVTQPLPSVSDIDFEGQDRTLLYVSSLPPHKNHEGLVRALGRLREQGTEPVRVDCPGVDVDGRRAYLENLADSLGVGDWIRFHGFVERARLVELYKQTSAVISTTRYEAFSGTLLEALQFARPIACSAIPPLTRFLDMPEVPVATFDPESPADIAEAIEKLFENRSYYRKGALRARELLSQITPLRTAQQYREVFAWACGQGSRPEWYPSRELGRAVEWGEGAARPASKADQEVARS